MKPLYWTVIDSRKIPNTIWQKVNDTKVKINLQKIEDEFSIKKPAPINTTTSLKTPAKPSKISFLTSQRQQNISVVLGKIRMKIDDIIDSFILYNTSKLTPKTCELLLPILPTESEIVEISSHEGDFDLLMECDLFCLSLGSAPYYNLRCKSIIFKSIYKKEVKEIMDKVENFYEMFEFFKKNPSLMRWLEFILAVGNYLNGTSARGGAYAFKLDILTKLTELKTNDNKKTLMFYLVENIAENDEKLLDITKHLDKLSDMNLQGINDSFKDLNMKFKAVNELNDKTKEIEEEANKNEEEDGTREFLSTFYDDAKLDIQRVDEKIKNIEEKFKEVVSFYGENPKDVTIENFFDTFTKLNKDITSNKILYSRYKEMKEKEKAKLLQQEKKNMK